MIKNGYFSAISVPSHLTQRIAETVNYWLKSYLRTHERVFQIEARPIIIGLFSKSGQELSIDMHRLYILYRFNGQKGWEILFRKFWTKNQFFFYFFSFKPPGGYLTIFNQIVTSNRIRLFEWKWFRPWFTLKPRG